MKPYFVVDVNDHERQYEMYPLGLSESDGEAIGKAKDAVGDFEDSNIYGREEDYRYTVFAIEADGNIQVVYDSIFSEDRKQLIKTGQSLTL